MSRAIEVRDLTYHYPDQARAALNHVSFSIDAGEWVAVIGHNGSGKSTLAKNLNGLLAPEAGTVVVSGLTLSDQTVWTIREKIGMVFQNPDNQFVGATVADDVAFDLENRGVPREEMLTRVQAALEAVQMSDFADREPARLSGGQKQRVAIAGIVAQRPDILILDEATSMLDPAGREDIISLIRQLREQTQLTVISITHDIDEAAAADRVLLLNDGEIVEDTTPNQLFTRGSELTNLGLDVPFAEKLKAALSERGVTVPRDYFDEEGLVAYLWTLRSTM